MAYVNNETKTAIQAALKPVFKKYGIKATVAKGSYNSSLVVNVSAGDIDFGTDYQQVNIYWIDDNHTGKAKDFLNEVLREIKRAGEWYDESDSQIDYFNTAFYISINIGRWDKPYVHNKKNNLVQALTDLGKFELIVVS